MDAKVTLSEALEELRRELYAAQDAGAGQQLRFEVEQAQLTLEVEFHRDADGKVKVEVGLPGAKAGAEAGGGVETTRRQTLALTLQVHDEALGGSRAKIRRQPAENPAPDQRPSGAEAPAEESGNSTRWKREWER
ncbi:trypco2 family protein [Streptomyces sp. f150]|uniref:trypco2 family protein n=1 Tax=Streptomyces sp. f150 TaxID=1827699 RepID=UPI000BF01266|nr:trypco2 family protein [Streptomyces sp. f150]